jgi:hypothetical protein
MRTRNGNWITIVNGTKFFLLCFISPSGEYLSGLRRVPKFAEFETVESLRAECPYTVSIEKDEGTQEVCPKLRVLIVRKKSDGSWTDGFVWQE